MEESADRCSTQPGLMRTAVIGICGVLLVLFVLRPVGTAGDGDAARAGVAARGGECRRLDSEIAEEMQLQAG